MGIDGITKVTRTLSYAETTIWSISQALPARIEIARDRADALSDLSVWSEENDTEERFERVWKTWRRAEAIHDRLTWRLRELQRAISALEEHAVILRDRELERAKEKRARVNTPA